MSHLCHALRCTEEIPPRLFMCLKHWNMVPKTAQRKLLALYRPGQEIDKQPSEEYARHAVQIVHHIADQENLAR